MKTQRFFPVVAAITLVFSVLACGSGQAGTGATSAPVDTDISGTYTVSGVNLEDRRYEGEVTIKGDGDHYTLAWTIGGGTQTGTGTLSGDTLTATWSDGTYGGDVTYKTQADGSLEGTWTQDGQTGKGTETLTPKQAPQLLGPPSIHSL